MRCKRCPWLRHALAAFCILLTAPSDVPAAEPAPSPPDAPRSAAAVADAPVNIYVGDPSDLNAVWKALTRPDFVILRGDEYAKLRARAGPGGPQAPWGYAVGSVAVEGDVSGELAELTARFGVALTVEGPVWVSIRLDGQALTSVREAGRDLPLRAAEGGGWQVELSGRGNHSIQAGLPVPVRVTPEGRRLDIAVPEAASTRVSILVPRRVIDARTGVGEPVAGEVVKPTLATRLTATLSPRARLALTWREDEDTGARLPPLLSAQGEIAVQVAPGSLRTRSSWSVRSARGTVPTIQFRLDTADELIDLEVDGRRPPASTEKIDGGLRVTIPLAEPLGPGQERRLVLTTRRSTPTDKGARVSFDGFPLLNVRDQAGAIGVAPSGNLWVTGIPGRGVRPIDPRTELPADLRARPATELAYQFSEQPFELALRVESSPPLVRASDRTTVVLEPRLARVDSWLDFETTRGRLNELTLGLPPGLEIESVGPPEVVGSLHTGIVPSAFLPGLAGGLRLLTVRLGPKAQESGRFAIHLVGRMAIDAAMHDVPVALFQPIGMTSAGGRVALVTDPSLTAELAGENVVAGAFRPALLSPPADWPWPSARPPAIPPMLWLRHDDSPAVLPLRVTVHPRTVSHSTSLQVRVDRREADVQQETECSVQFGSFDSLDVTVPGALAGRWDVEGPAVTQKTEIDRAPDGDRRVRLKLATELTRTVRLRFHYRLPLALRVSPETPATLTIPWVRLDASSEAWSPPHATVTVETGLDAEARPGSWAPASDSIGADDDSSLRLVLAGDPDPLTLKVSARALAEMPRLVAARLSIKTIQTPERDTRTTALYLVESHESSLPFALPTGAELIQVRVGGEAVRQVERLPEGAGYRLELPARLSNGPVLVEINYVETFSKTSGVWNPPRLLGGGIVQQTFWEVRIPWSEAVVGVPSGWTDENEWYWDAYVWKRRPWKSSAGLADWAGGPVTRPAAASGTGPDADPRGDYHSYLFGRPGGPAGLPLRIASRAWLVAVFSGSVLVVGGLLVLVWRPPLRMTWIAGMVLGLSVATLLHPSVTFLAVQSGMVGLFLVALLALMHRLVGRRGSGTSIYVEAGSRAAGFIPQGSTLTRVVTVGSDDSTAIRSRPIAPNSTMDYVPTHRPPASEGSALTPESRSERAGRGGAGP